MSTPAEDALRDAVAGPKRVKGDAGEVEQYDLDDLIKADRHLKGEEAAEKGRRGLRFTKLKPPGAL